MPSSNLLNTSTTNINDVLGNGKIYKVPQFQRDYSWMEDNWEDLWNDLANAKESEKPHYMGSIVLQNNGSKEFFIIDGQQRFTTVSLLILAFINQIRILVDEGVDVNENKERVELLMKQYIGQKNPSSLKYSSKLFLNENNDGFYQQRLLAFKNPINESKLSTSEKLLWQAYKFFKDRIEKNFSNYSGSEIATYINTVIGELLMFIQITVEDELNAYTVFETLNSRGVELTATDLLKNYLFSLVAKSSSDLSQVKSQWKRIIDIITLKKFPTFLRYYLLATRKYLTKEYLFKEVKNYVTTDEDVFELLDHLEEYAYIYIALGSPDDELWDTDKENKDSIRALKLFGVTQWKSLALVAYEKLNTSSFRRLLNALVALSFRYNVIGRLQTNEMEKTFSRAAVKLYSGEAKNITGVLNLIKGLYVSDEDFKTYFSTRQFNTSNSKSKKIARYILYSIEAQSKEGNSYDYELDSGTIEHILPESYPDDWHDDFNEDEFEKNIYMLGNMTLLESRKNNKDAADKSYEEKKKVYLHSNYFITKSITAPEWNPRAIKHRQASMAKTSTGIWKINFN